MRVFSITRVALVIAGAFFTLLAARQLPAQTAGVLPPLPGGQLTESVACASDPTQTYALYLPSGYTPAKLWPIIYAFDPVARGSVPLQLYKDIAEKYGFILVGSNNSRNFAAAESAKGANAMWLDTHTRLSLDERRIYVTGFSGGARMAGSIALGCPQCKIAGVIAHGAGYPSTRKPGTKDTLLYFFAVGDQDFNWPEVIGIRREREEQGMAYRERGFSGPHQWAPAEVMEDAVEWVILKAMQSGSQPPDVAFIDRFLHQMQDEAADAEKRGDAIAQLNSYRALASDFSGLRDVGEYEKKLTALKKSSALKSALGKERDVMAEQRDLEQDIFPKLETYTSGKPDDPVSLGREIVQAMRRLTDQSAHAKSEEKRLVAARAFRELWAEGIEAGQSAFEAHHFDKAVDCFQLMSSAGDEPWPVLLLAETHAVLGDKKAAMKDLRESVRRGLQNASTIENDGKLQSLRGESDYQKLIEELKSKTTADK